MCYINNSRRRRRRHRYRYRHQYRRRPQFSLYSYLFADSDTFKMRYFSAPIRFVFFFICNVRELLKRVISLRQFSLYSHLFADKAFVLNAVFLCLNSLCILFYLQWKRSSKTRYFSAAILFVFVFVF